MKKVMAFLGCIAMVCTLTTSAHAFLRKDMDFVQGKIVASDPKAKTITIAGTSGEGNIKVTTEGADITVSTDVGTEVVAIYKKDTAVATIIKPAK